MRVACAQLNVAFDRPEVNVAKAIQVLRDSNQNGVDLVVLPECFLTGYCVSTREDAARISLEIPGSGEQYLKQISAECQTLGIHCVVGFAQKSGSDLFNSAALVEPSGKINYYQKTHLPHLGYDRFASPGSELTVFDCDLGKIGVLICFDLRHPEPTRVLALQGAELIVLPTNWPVGAHAGPNFVASTRAAENRVFFATCNRVGDENSFSFIGQSGIYEVTGLPLAKAGTEEEIIVADIDLAEARIKKTVIRPDEYEITMFQSRRPELYGELIRSDS